MGGGVNDEHDPGLALRGIAAGAIGIVVMIALAAAAAWWAWSAWKPLGTDDGPDGPLDFAVAGARLESAPKTDRKAYFDEKERVLHSWGWVDRRAGIARIPIDEAMGMLARQGAVRNQARGKATP
jgi:hypothetical protein